MSLNAMALKRHVMKIQYNLNCAWSLWKKLFCNCLFISLSLSQISYLLKLWISYFHETETNYHSFSMETKKLVKLAITNMATNALKVIQLFVKNWHIVMNLRHPKVYRLKAIDLYWSFKSPFQYQNNKINASCWIFQAKYCVCFCCDR